MTTKHETTHVKLIYPPYLYGRPHVAEVVVRVRLTPKQIIVESIYNRRPQIVYVNGHTRGPTGLAPMKYWRHNGVRVGGYMRSWRLAPGELERVNAEAAQRKAER